MKYLVENTKTPWQIAPASQLQEVIQNVRLLLCTEKYTCPLEREFGVETSILDKPLNVIQVQLAAQLAKDIPLFEPRAKLTALEVQSDDKAAGHLKITATIEVTTWTD